MLMGVPPQGSPPEWGLSLRYSLGSGLVSRDTIAGRYVKFPYMRKILTGIVVAADSDSATIYSTESGEEKLYKIPSNKVTMITRQSQSTASQKEIDDVMLFLRTKVN